ncbi:MAG: hypothetical protein GWO44_01710, partial [Thermoplasmata archaeon]|nr:hypothetical protein [Thermoplasmata archaeon]NIY02011.1 hypothetical protein [Thermoplasmata archaeon]
NDGIFPNSVGDVAEIARAIMNDRDEPIDHVPSEAVWKMAGQALKATEDFVLQYWPYGKTLDIVGVEERMEMHLGTLDDGTEIWLAGTADL